MPNGITAAFEVVVALQFMDFVTLPPKALCVKRNFPLSRSEFHLSQQADLLLLFTQSHERLVCGKDHVFKSWLWRNQFYSHADFVEASPKQAQLLLGLSAI